MKEENCEERITNEELEICRKEKNQRDRMREIERMRKWEWKERQSEPERVKEVVESCEPKMALKWRDN